MAGKNREACAVSVEYGYGGRSQKYPHTLVFSSLYSSTSSYRKPSINQDHKKRVVRLNNSKQKATLTRCFQKETLSVKGSEILVLKELITNGFQAS